MKRKTALVFSVIFVIAAIFSAFPAHASEISEKADSYYEIPLIVILADYDANGNGIDDYDPENPTKLYSDKTQDYYGEQWTKTAPASHYDTFFGKGNSLRNFYLEMTCGQFTYQPIQFENADGVEHVDGIIEVSIPQMHPSAYNMSASDYGSFCLDTIEKIIEACDPYVDFNALDKDGNGLISQKELGIVILNAGPDHYKTQKYQNPGTPQSYFAVHGTSQPVTAYVDDVMIMSSNGAGNATNQGEYSSVGTIINVGVPAHELAHNLGAEDLYNRAVRATGKTVANWPQPYNFSLQCNGNNASGGKSPTYLDPYQRIKIGWVTPQVVEEDGVYTLHSTLSGKYNVLRINTPDKDEYYLVEIRMKEGFERLLTAGPAKGGIMIWHIDETVNSRYYSIGMACSSYADTLTGERHDPGIQPMFRNGYSSKGTGLLQTTSPSDPFYYKSSKDGTQTFNSNTFVSPTNHSASLNSYPEFMGDYEYNLNIEVLSEPGAEMQVRVTGATKPFIAPPETEVVSYVTSSFKTSVTAEVQNIGNNVIGECGILISKSETPDSENGMYVRAVYDAETHTYTAEFERLDCETDYYCVGTVNGTNLSSSSGVFKLRTADSPASLTYTDPKTGLKTVTVYEAGATMRAPEEPVRSGYVFAGWYTDEKCKTAFDFSSPAVSGTEYDIYAGWKLSSLIIVAIIAGCLLIVTGAAFATVTVIRKKKKTQ